MITCAFCGRVLRLAFLDTDEIDGVPWFTCRCDPTPQPHLTPAILTHVAQIAATYQQRPRIVRTPKTFCIVDNCIQFALPARQWCALHGNQHPAALPHPMEESR